MVRDTICEMYIIKVYGVLVGDSIHYHYNFIMFTFFFIFFRSRHFSDQVPGCRLFTSLCIVEFDNGF